MVPLKEGDYNSPDSEGGLCLRACLQKVQYRKEMGRADSEEMWQILLELSNQSSHHEQYVMLLTGVLDSMC